MSKGKPRHHPEKKQNSYGNDGHCRWYDGETSSGTAICEAGISGAKCGGNLHNCASERYRFLASLKPEQRENPSYHKKHKRRKTNTGGRWLDVQVP